MPVVEIRGIKKTYRLGEVEQQALDGVDLAVEAGDFMALAGPSGSGKTTMLNIIGCLDAPTAGEVFLEGRPVARLKPNRLAEIRRERLGFVFQSYNLIPVLTALENVEYPLILNGIKPAERRRRAMEILAEVGLAGKEGNLPGQLSGGQQQRVAIARALVHRPSLILADEPTANLDSHTGQEIIDLMRRLNRDHGATFIFATHDQRIMDRASRLVKLEDGKIA